MDNFSTYSNTLSQPQIPPNPWASGGTLTASSVLLPQQLLQQPQELAVNTDTNSQTKAAVTPSPKISPGKNETVPVISEASRPSSYIVRFVLAHRNLTC